MPTILETFGLDIPDAVHGKSYLPLLEGSSEVTREELMYGIMKQTEGEERFPISERGIRTEQFLYVRTEKSPQLHINVKEDPFELHNPVDRLDYAEIMKEFDRKINSYMEETGDRWDIEVVVPAVDYTSHEEGMRIPEDLHAKAIVELQLLGITNESSLHSVRQLSHGTLYI